MKTKGENQIVRTIIGGITVLCIIFVICFLLEPSATDVKQIRYGNGWNVTIEGKEYKNVSLNEFSFQNAKKGTEVVLTNKIPDSVKKTSTLEMLVYLSVVDVYVDGKQVYTYGHEEYDADQLVGSGYHFIQLPENSAGKDIMIKITMTENHAFTSFSEFKITDAVHTYFRFSENNKVAAFISLFMFVLGALLTAVSIFAYSQNQIYRRLIYIGIFSWLIGMWSMCNSKVIQMFTLDLSRITFMEYMSLYSVVLPFTALIYDMRKDDETWRRNLLKAVFFIFLGFAVITFILHMTGIVHYPGTITSFHILGCIGLAMTFFACKKKRDQATKADKVLFAGIVVMCICITLDIIRFNVQKYVFPEKTILLVSVIPIGVLLFIIFMLISYLIYLYDMALSYTERQMLTKLAYQDTLTGLYNRAECEQQFAKMDSGSDEYMIVNMDLNGLKYINDTYGHAKGDILITSFADILKKVFGEYAVPLRMGGDEFLVLAKERDYKKLLNSLEEMRKQEKYVSEKLGFPVYASYGIAHSNELVERNAEKVYALADKRMYEMKVKTKASKEKS